MFGFFFQGEIKCCCACAAATLPDGDHFPRTALDVPAAVEARRVIYGPGRAVEDPPPLRVDLHLLCAGRCNTPKL